jgi:hypothetical protein
MITAALIQELKNYLIRSIAMTAFHDISMASITGDEVAFSGYSGQLCLLVNVASK